MAVITNVDNGNETGATLRIPAGAENPILKMRITRRGLLGLLPFAALTQAGTVALAGFNLGRYLERNTNITRPRVVISGTVIDAAKPEDILAYPDGVYFGELFANSTYSEPNIKSNKFTKLGFSIFPDNAINNHDASGDPIVIVKGHDQFNYYRIPMATQTQAVRNDFGNQDYVYINVAKSDPLYKIVNGHGDNKVAK